MTDYVDDIYPDQVPVIATVQGTCDWCRTRPAIVFNRFGKACNRCATLLSQRDPTIAWSPIPGTTVAPRA